MEIYILKEVIKPEPTIALTTPANTAAGRNLPALTGLRGVGALWVVAFHGGPVLHRLGFPFELPFARYGFLGVDLFFILSGFILHHVYVKAFRPYSVREHLHFLLIRLARIYPLHLAAMLVLGVVVLSLPGFTLPFVPGTFTARGFWVATLLLQNWAPQQLIWNAPAWSLSAEWAAYLAIPLPFLLVRKIRSGRLALALAVASLAVLAGIFVYKRHAMEYTGSVGFLRLGFEFTAGCLISRANQLDVTEGKRWRILDAISLVLLAFALLFPPSLPLALVAFGILILSLTNQTGVLSTVLSTPIAEFFGNISYSVYLFHWILIQIAEWYLAYHATTTHTNLTLANRTALGLLLLCSIVVIPYWTYRTVELPARRYGRKLANRLVSQKQQATFAP